jgi:hypothetical protein
MVNQEPLFEDFLENSKPETPEPNPVEEPKDVLTFNMMYNQLLYIRKHVERLEAHIEQLDNRVRQYSARVALAIDGDTPNVE